MQPSSSAAAAAVIQNVLSCCNVDSPEANQYINVIVHVADRPSSPGYSHGRRWGCCRSCFPFIFSWPPPCHGRHLAGERRCFPFLFSGGAPCYGRRFARGRRFLLWFLISGGLRLHWRHSRNWPAGEKRDKKCKTDDSFIRCQNCP